VFYDCLTPYPPDTWLKAGSRHGEKIGAAMSLCFVAIFIGITFADYGFAPTRPADGIRRRTSA
jgi:hypothetical protein